MRKEPRLALGDEVSLIVAGCSAELAQVMDVSAHGMRVRFHRDLAPQSPVQVRLVFLNPDHPEETLAVFGIVRHRFPEPGGTSWQIGLWLDFVGEAQEKAFLATMETLTASL